MRRSLCVSLRTMQKGSKETYLNFTSPHTGQLVTAAATTLRGSNNRVERRRTLVGRNPKRRPEPCPAPLMWAVARPRADPHNREKESQTFQGHKSETGCVAQSRGRQRHVTSVLSGVRPMVCYLFHQFSSLNHLVGRNVSPK